MDTYRRLTTDWPLKLGLTVADPVFGRLLGWAAGTIFLSRKAEVPDDQQ